jgi:hypothetical protein
MNFITDYLEAIDYVALVTLAILAFVSIYRREGLWIGVLGLAVLFWVAARFTHII